MHGCMGEKLPKNRNELFFRYKEFFFACFKIFLKQKRAKIKKVGIFLTYLDSLYKLIGCLQNVNIIINTDRKRTCFVRFWHCQTFK